MILISSVLYFSEREERQWYGLEYWLSNFCYFFTSLLSHKYSPVIVALPSLFWIWRVSTMRKILGSVAHVNLSRKWHMPLLLSSFVLSGILAYAGFSFTWFTFPQAFSMFVVVLDYLNQSKRQLQKEKIAPTHYLLFFSIFLIICHSLDYPFFRYKSEFASMGFGIVLLTNILMAIILPALTIYEMKQQQKKKFEEILRGQAKFSALGEMTMGIAHEMNNPLGIILHRANHLRTQVLQNNIEKESLVRNLDHIQATSENMTKIIRSLKNYSVDNKNEEFSTVNLINIVEETLSYCKDRMRLHSIDLILDKVPDVMIQCRTTQIAQVILNLLNNAFDAVVGLEEKWIKISFNQKVNSIEILVTDSGPGIPFHIRKKMMQPFFTTKTTASTGLGLSIAMNIVEGHNGKLSYEEQSGHTTLKVELPLEQIIRYSQSS
jgi:signal transduction histidine kinase